MALWESTGENYSVADLGTAIGSLSNDKLNDLIEPFWVYFGFGSLFPKDSHDWGV